VLQEMVSESIANATKAAGMNAPPATVLVSSPNTRFALNASSGSAAILRAHKSHRERAGYCGAADAGLLLAAALDLAKAGDTILIVSAVGGTDAILVSALRDGPGARNEHGTSEVSYFNYLTWRGLLEREPARRPDRPPVSAPAAFRNQAWKFGLQGSRCMSCLKVYLPPQRVCGGCNEQDKMQPYHVVGRRAQIAAMSTDAVVDSPAPPAIIATIDIDGGGRVNVELTDAANKVATVGAEVEFTFRRTYVTRGTPNYFWKARLALGESS
jgi:hydroxymethylglutaryl-CoA synthase